MKDSDLLANAQAARDIWPLKQHAYTCEAIETRACTCGASEYNRTQPLYGSPQWYKIRKENGYAQPSGLP